MTIRQRIVIDAGVMVSATLLKRSVPRQAYDRGSAVGRLLVSRATITELDEVLRRPKFDRYLTQEDRLGFLASYLASAETVIVTHSVRKCRDPKDDKYLELALSGQAEVIISGDPDLLALHPFQGIAILTPRQYLDLSVAANGE